MANQDLSIYFAIMAVSAVLVLSSFVVVSKREKSWINWYILPVAGTLAANYLLPSIFMWNFGTTGSYYAYFYCYTTYACVAMATAAGYLWLPPLQFKQGGRMPLGRIGVLPWALLAIAFLLYLPVLIEFREFILQPREIYLRTRTGYGIYFFFSTLFVNLAYVTYLFKQKKSFAGTSVLLLSCAILVYLHGSKGQLIVLAFVGVLYWVYVKKARIRLRAAMLLLPPAALLVALLFFAFGTATDADQLVLQMAGYSDYTSNAMMVIDDPHLPRYWGQLELEEELYSRVPRVLVPSKPKEFGEFRLALRYFPEWFYSDAGSPSFGIGKQYADFGVFSIVLLSFTALIQGWFAKSAVRSLASCPTVGRFVVLLFFADLTLLPLGTGYLLPETLILGWGLDFMLSGRLFPFHHFRPRGTALAVS